MKLQFSLIALTFVLVTALFCPPVFADDVPTNSEAWEFTIIPYLWAAGIDGDVTVKGIKTSTDLSFSDIFENLDFGGMARFEATKGRWGLFFDPTYMKLSADGKFGPRRGIDVDVDIEMALVELGAFYRVFERPLASESNRSVLLDVLGGGRYTHLKLGIDIDDPFGLLSADVDKSKDWIDPIIGGRIQVGLTEKLDLRIRADIGGFGIGSDFTWNLMATLGYSISERTTLWFGYRILDVDYDDGSGPNLFEYDINMSGPLAGLAITF